VGSFRIVEAGRRRAATDHHLFHSRFRRRVQHVPGAPHIGVEDHLGWRGDRRVDGGEVHHRVLSAHGGTERVEIQDVYGKMHRTLHRRVDGRSRVFLPVQHADITATRELPDDVPSEASGSPRDEHSFESHVILRRTR
jgi:hypothetical protein